MKDELILYITITLYAIFFCFAFTLFNNEICYRLPIKIYIDSRPKTEESASHTD